MEHYTLDGREITTLDALYDELTRIFEFPEYFGRNLDALAECLSDLVNDVGPVTLAIQNHRKIQIEVPEWKSVLEVFRSNQDITLELD